MVGKGLGNDNFRMNKKKLTPNDYALYRVNKKYGVFRLIGLKVNEKKIKN